MPYKKIRGQNKMMHVKRIIELQKINDGLPREQTLGIIDSESCLFDTKRKLRTTLVWCIYHAVSLYIKR